MAETSWEKAAAETETAWEKTAVGKMMEMAKKMAQTEKRTAQTQKRTVKTRKTVKETHEIAAVNEKMKWESLYQNCCNICQTDGRTILYNL
jgi:hypothetical protein